MTLIEFVTKLRSIGYPVAFSHFNVDGDNPAPTLPFITYLTPSTSNKIADDKVYKKITNVDVELYTVGKDLVAEQLLEDMFDDNNIPYEAVQIWIESEKVFQKQYELRLI